jgi:hypothetical protein
MSPASRAKVQYQRDRLRQCDLDYCFEPTKTLSRYCKRHDKTNEQTGAPEGRVILVRELRPYQKHCRKFIKANRGHAGIEAALQWLEEILQFAAERDPGGALYQTPKTATCHWLANLQRHGVEPLEILSTVSAVLLHERSDPRRYLAGRPGSDRFLKHQISIRVLRLAEAPNIELWSGGKQSWRAPAINVGVRDFLSATLLSNIGVVVARIAQAVEDLYRPAQQVSGSAEPFPNSTPNIIQF